MRIKKAKKIFSETSEETKESIEEVVKNTTEELLNKGIEFTKGYELAKQTLYTEDEVLKLLHNYRNNFELYRNIQVLPNVFFEWFNKNKKQ